ncbi:MAG: lipopolysaccharide biosynthesis protein [Novosphingobium sp.]
MNDQPGSLRAHTMRGVGWSIVQNWGGKVFTFMLSILLARLLSPEEFGVASAAWLALMLVPLVAEMGFGDAIMQRRGLKDADVNLPFWLASAIASALVVVVVILREPIAQWAGLGDRESYLVAIAATILISVPTGFQEAFYKRHMKFKQLAVRSFAANISGGIAAVAAAALGFGVWSFVVQMYVSLVINVVWIWARPEWLPGLRMEPRAFLQMARFGAPVLAQRLVDFAGTRMLDFMIIAKIGLVGYGIYVVGSRLYLTMMQLLQGAFQDVSLTVLSTIAHERERVAEVYRKTISLSATAMLPVFVLLSALAPEICLVLFGHKWVGVDRVAQPLLLMGAIHCVQYINGSFLSARGKPELILVTGVVKSALQIAALLLVPGGNVQTLTLTFVMATVLASPLSFYVLSRELGISMGQIASLLARPAAMSAACFAAVHFARPAVEELSLPALFQGGVLGTLFTGLYLVLLVIFDRHKAMGYADFVLQMAQRKIRYR